MTDRLEKIGSMLDGTGSPSDFDADLLKDEIARLERPHTLGGIAADRVPGGPERLVALKRRLKDGPVQRAPESNYARLAREAIAAEDEAELDAVEQPSDLAAALERRAKALATLDAALDKIGAAVALIHDADTIILNSTTGRKDLADAKSWLHLGHVAERVQARLGDIGIARDVRWDKSEPSPRLAGLASCHELISTKKERAA